MQDKPSQQPLVYAGFWRRALAVIIDVVIVFLPVGFLFSVTEDPYPASVPGQPIHIQGGNDHDAYIVLFWLGLAAVYFIAYPLTHWRATPGKSLLGIEVVRPNGGKISLWRSVVRYLMSLVSTWTLVGYVTSLFDEKRRSLHDFVAGTVVVRRQDRQDARQEKSGPEAAMKKDG